MAQGGSLFPAYASTKAAATEGDARPTLVPSSPTQTQEAAADKSETSNNALPDWLCNASYDPALQDLLRQPQQEDEEESEGSQSRSSESSESSPAAEERLTRHRRSKPKGAECREAEDAAQPLLVGKRRFRFLLGFAGEERFCVDPKPDRSLLAFEQLPFTALAVYHRGWRCDTVPEESRISRRKRVRRYWDLKVRHRACVANLAQPRLSFAQSERNLAYVSIRDLQPPEPARDDSVDPLHIHDAATRSYLQGEMPVGKKELFPGGGEAARLLCPETAARQRALCERLREAPEDERAWLELATFQDEFMAALEEASGMHRTQGRAKAVREKKLEVLEQGLLKTKGSVLLHLHKIQVLLECGEEARAGKAWEELLRVHPGNARLWLEHARFLQAETTLSGFHVDAAARGYLRALSCFRDMLEGRRATRREPLEVERNIVEVCRQYGVFLCQCGLWERAVATFQALAELSMRCPPRLAEAPLEEALALLEPFWDSGAPRFGDEGARGWAYLMEQLGSGQASALDAATTRTATTTQDDCQELEDEIMGRRPSLGDAWLRLESLRDLRQWRPYRPDLSAEEVTSEDPERMVLYEDVGPALFRLRQPVAKLHLFQAWLSLLLGVDPEKSQTSFSLAEADCFERLPGADLRMATRLSEALEFPSGWEVRQGVADFAYEVLSQAKPHFVEPALGDELARLALRLTRLATSWDARKRKRCAKAWLADSGRERNLDLWTEYGLLLVDLGQPQDAAAIYEKALDTVSRPGALAECRGDIWLLLATYLNLRLGVLHPEEGEEPVDHASSFSKDQALLVLSWVESGRKFRDVLASPLQPSALLRAGAAIHTCCQDPSGRTAGAVGVALWTKFFVSGFQAASALAREWMDACTGSTEAGLQQLGVVHMSFVRVCTYQDQQSRTQRAALSGALSKALRDAPNVASFLWQWISLATGSLGALHVRRCLRELVKKECSPLAWLVALCFELCRAQALTNYRTPDASFTLPNFRNHVRHILEQAVESVAHRRCPLLWRLYIELELRLGTRESAKAVFYRALQCCPWSKVLYVDGVRHFPECLQEVVDMMVEKGIRLRVPLEELQLLLEHAQQQHHSSPND
ncbi:nuclear exosome regulator NRDE2 isoform X2 [Amblyomma americanum]